MKRNYFLFFIAICGILFCGSCTKKGSTGATGPGGPAGPAYKGAITGYVSVYDEYGNKTIPNFSNFQLTLKGGTTVTCNNNGYYIFDNVATGTYNITASGTGYAPTLVNNIGFVNDTFFQDIKLSAIPDFNLSTFHAYHNTGSLYDSLVITLASDTRARNLIVFVNNTSAVGNAPANNITSYIKSIPTSVWPTTTQVVMKLANTDLNNVNIFYGEETYYAASSYVVNDASVYEDPATGKPVYTAIGTALVDSCIAP